MAYAGRCDVTKQIVMYVKEHRYMSNQGLDRNIQRLYGCTYADSTYNKIRNGEYDAKFNLTNHSSYSSNQGWNSTLYDEIDDEDSDYENSISWNRKIQTKERDYAGGNKLGNRESYSKGTTSSDNSKKVSGSNYLIAFCSGGIGIYGLFHGATPFQNFGAFVVALILIAIAIAHLSGE